MSIRLYQSVHVGRTCAHLPPRTIPGMTWSTRSRPARVVRCVAGRRAISGATGVEGCRTTAARGLGCKGTTAVAAVPHHQSCDHSDDR